MHRHLERFYRELAKEWKGSLVKVSYCRQRNSKEYLSRLAKKRKVERISWGWYFVTAEISGVFDFLRKDRNFKVLVAQSAASFWNQDFIHRNVYSLVVKDRSYKKALEEFGRKRKWNFIIEVVEDAERKVEYENVRGLNVEKPAESVAECMQNWAFTDAFAVIQANKKILPDLKRFYWKRISGTNTRIGQVISYGIHRNGKVKMPSVLRGDIDESVERVSEFA